MILGKRIWWTSFWAASVLMLFSTAAGFAQEPETSSTSASSTSDTPAEVHAPDKAIVETKEPPEPPGGNHVFGVLPNYRTVNESEVKGPLTNRQKLSIASKDSFDYPLVLLAGGLAGIGQWSNQNPSFGQGMS